MAESNEQQVLENIRTEVDEAQNKVILATQCIKAQAFLVRKLKQQVQRNKETCCNLSSANVKLQFEITHAEQEIKSFLIAKETIKMANVELKKELLIAEDKKLDLMERVKRGEKKYEELWLESKARIERLPYVQKLHQAVQKAESLKKQILALDTQIDSLYKDVYAKREACVNIERNRIIELAQFIIHDRPRLLEEINEKTKAIKDLKKDMDIFNLNIVTVEDVAEPEDYIMPKHQLPEPLDLDDLMSVNIAQLNMNKADYIRVEFEKKESFSKSYFDITTSVLSRKTDLEESISSYITKPGLLDDNNEQIYSRRKLINILDDVKVDSSVAMDLILRVNPDTLQEVETISAEPSTSATKTIEEPNASEDLIREPMQTEQVQEIDMITSNEEDIVKPPTQFLDESLKSQKSQETKKTVSFDLSITLHTDVIRGNANKSDALEENIVNKATNSPLDLSAASDDGFDKIKDKVLKKRNLDLTPPFVYAKNIILQKKDEEVKTSKFFRANENEPKEKTENEKQLDKNEADTNSTIEECNRVEEIDDAVIVSSPKKQKLITEELCKPTKPFSEYQLFNHGSQGLPESLDVSMRTTGYEDDDDFPHCIDLSLHLSPKADDAMCNEIPEVQSQEAPNFLSGLRKTGLSFFGQMGAGNSKTDSSAANQNDSGFSFNFGGKEKKNRSGLFSMFQ